MKIINQVPNVISMSNMRDGDIAVIVSWSDNSHKGEIVQRYKNNLIRLGRPAGQGWGDVFERPFTQNPLVAILPVGTQLEID